MSASGFFKMQKLKGSGKVLAASRHNKRAIQAEQGADSHIDAARICLNLSLHGPDTPEAVASLARLLMAAAGVRPQKKNAVLALEQVFSLPANTDIDLKDYFNDCVQWVAQNFGGLDNVLSADVHLDESAPHLHVLILPLIDGRMNGSDLFGNRQRLQFLQNDFHTAVAGRYGLAKAPARLQGQAKAKTAQTVMNHIHATSDTAQTSALWPLIRDLIARDPVACAQVLGLEVTKTADKPQRSTAQIFTSKGKGSNKPLKPIGFAYSPKPIGLERSGKSLSLCSVGLANKPTTPAQAPRPAIQLNQNEDTRVIVREDCDFSGWQDSEAFEQSAWQ
nr:plasmid recombination protein [uncultured Rhodoferax sp.]